MNLPISLQRQPISSCHKHFRSVFFEATTKTKINIPHTYFINNEFQSFVSKSIKSQICISFDHNSKTLGPKDDLKQNRAHYLH